MIIEPDFIKKNNKPLICIQGLGFVGIAMMIAVASRFKNKENIFNVIGVELNNPKGKKIVNDLNSGILPIKTTDKNLKKSFKNIVKKKNFFATTKNDYIQYADIIISDVNLDLKKNKKKIYVDFNNFNSAMKIVGKFMKENALIIVETTVPPGTSDKIAIPIINKERKKRGFNKNLNFAFSYERVMPGNKYLDSIINFWRVYSGNSKESQIMCSNFFKKIINTKEFPMTKLSNLAACETSKILENSYRATNIAFIDEWSRFAENIGIDLYEVIDAIKIRPTHSNIMYPGLGVGGYCLTKDPLFAVISAKQIHKMKSLNFPLSEKSVEINHNMPNASVKILLKHLKSLKNKKILIMGLSYRSDTDDTRHSPSTEFAKKLLSKKALVYGHDPLVSSWGNFEKFRIKSLNNIPQVDALVLAVKHKEYTKIDVTKLKNKSKIILDTNNILSTTQKKKISEKKFQYLSLGRK
tara:strand:- start:372 stop:1772 length:1401 start_codon:yes stop_codon:yes gene_type:complete